MKVSWYTGPEQPRPFVGCPITVAEDGQTVGAVTAVAPQGDGHLVRGEIAEGALIGGPAQQVFSVGADLGPRPPRKLRRDR